MSFSLVHREHGDCWLHDAKPAWIVHYQATQDRAQFYQAYRTVARVPAGRDPWTVDNRRIGTERGFPTFDEAAQAAEAA